jgi:hypothetical protein
MGEMLKFGICALSVLSALAEVSPAPKAVEIAHAMMQAMGGQETWNRVHFVRFDFKVIMNGQPMIGRSYLWDKQAGRCRLEDRAADGRQGVVLFSDVRTARGAAYIGDKKLDGPAAARALKAAHSSFINDVNWLIMPWVWLQPGVHLQYQGRKSVNGQPFDVVEVRFDPPQANAGDRYTAYVSPRTHLMEAYEYVLRNGAKGSWEWQYTTTSGLKLASNHVNGTGAAIVMGDVRVLDRVDNEYMTEPTHWLSGMRK